MPKKHWDIHSIEFARKLVEDPVFFAREVLGVEPWPIQEVILASVRDRSRTLVQACHASSKTHTASILAVWFMVTRGPCVVFTTAPTGRQVKHVLWKEIHSRLAGSKIELPGRPLQVEWKINHDHFAFGFSTNTADSFQGIHSDNVLGIFDEASGIEPPIWEAAEGNLSTMGSRFLGIGNPLDPASQFYNACHKDPRVQPIIISAYDTPYFYLNEIEETDIFDGSWREKFDPKCCPWRNLCHPEYAEGMYRMYGENSAPYIVRVKGEFPMTSEKALIPFWAIEAAQQRWTEDPKDCEVYDPSDAKIGVDVADGGDDLSARCIVQGGYVQPIRLHSKHDPVETGDIARDDFLEFEAKIVKVDSIGVGAGTVGQLRKLEVPHIGINVGTRSRYPKRFRNLKAEGWWHLREQFVKGRIAIPPHDRQLEEELMNMQVEYPESGQVAIEPKEKLKERIGRSPDRADALMLAFIDRGGFAVADGGADEDPAEAARNQFAAAVDEQKDSVVERTLTTYMRQALRHARRR